MISLEAEDRASDSPYIETVTWGRTLANETLIRPAEINWHMVFVREHGNLHSFVVGPWTTSGNVRIMEGAEILWLRFKLGIFMPHLPTTKFLNMETALPEATGENFWLKGSVWQRPDFENADTFINRLMRQEILVHDPLVEAALQDRLRDVSPRTLRHRFVQSTGLTQKHIQQYHRAQRAAALLRQGVSILDTVYETGYYDQPHLTKSLRQFIGYTPAQIIQQTE